MSGGQILRSFRDNFVPFWQSNCVIVSMWWAIKTRRAAGEGEMKSSSRLVSASDTLEALSSKCLEKELFCSKGRVDLSHLSCSLVSSYSILKSRWPNVKSQLSTIMTARFSTRSRIQTYFFIHCFFGYKRKLIVALVVQSHDE